MAKQMNKPTPEMEDLLARSGSVDFDTASRASTMLAKALTLPLRQGVLNGDIVKMFDIFEPQDFKPGQAVEYPLDFLNPGTEKDFKAYTIPNTGRIPERHVEGDYLMVPTYDVGASIDWALKYSREARWDIVGRAMEVLEASFVRKMNDDAWRCLLMAAVGRNIVVYDDASTSGLFTKRVVSLMKTIMRRSAGGNSASKRRGKLTDIFLSPEALEDMRSWDLTQVDDVTRREIYLQGDAEGMNPSVFKTVLHDLDELGVNQDYQNYYLNTLGGTLPAGKSELIVGLDLTNRDSFVMPVKQEIQVFEDPTFHRQRRAGVYGFGEYGLAVLDARRVVAGSI